MYLVVNWVAILPVVEVLLVDNAVAVERMESRSDLLMVLLVLKVMVVETVDNSLLELLV